MPKRIATLKEIADVLIKALGDNPPPVKKQTWSNWTTQKGKGKFLELPRAALSLGIEPNALLLRDADELGNEDQVALQQIRGKLIALRQIYSGEENPLAMVDEMLDRTLRMAYERAGKIPAGSTIRQQGEWKTIEPPPNDEGDEGQQGKGAGEGPAPYGPKKPKKPKG